MLRLRLTTQRCSIKATQNVRPLTCRRNVSLTSAIGNGVRKAGEALKKAEAHRVREGTLGFWELKDKDKVERVRQKAGDRNDHYKRLDWLRKDSEALSDDQNSHPQNDGSIQPFQRSIFRRTHGQSDGGMRSFGRGDQDWKAHAAKLAKLRAHGIETEAPPGIPYTEATSEFLYGTFPVLAALQAKRRKLHKLYIECGEDALPTEVEKATTEIVSLAKRYKVPIERVAGSWSKTLERMSDGRPHNGLVLDAGPIPKIPISELQQMDPQSYTVRAELSPLSNDDKLALSIGPDRETYSVAANLKMTKNRAPLLLWLDRLTDTGNVGAIMRTAHFLGVDGIILPTHGTAPLSGVTIKASAGAAESVKLFTIANERDFMARSQQNGWTFYAAAALESKSTSKRAMKLNHPEGGNTKSSPSDTLQTTPCVLMLGNEGEGLRPFLQARADHLISIDSASRGTDVVDSLNVSVAAALLIDRFLSTEMTVRPRFDVNKESSSGVDVVSNTN